MGLIPVGMKTFIHALDGNAVLQNITALDIIIWGFIVNLNIINERDGRFKRLFDSAKNTVHLSKIPVVCIVFYAIMYTYGLNNEKGLLNSTLYNVSVIFSGLTLAVCFAYIILHYHIVEKKESKEIKVKGEGEE